MKLTFKGNLKKQNYLTFSGGNDTGSFVAWDNVYIGKTTTGTNAPKVDKLDMQVVGNELRVSNNNAQNVSVYNVSGARLISTNQSQIDISNLASGVYIVKSGGLVNKFSK